MAEDLEDLKQWAIRFIKNKDAFTKSIVSIKENKEGFDVEYKDRSEQFFIIPNMSSSAIDPKENSSIVTLNKRLNIESVIKSWKELSKVQSLKIYFVNPGSNSKWILNPHTHNKICDQKTLKLGLISLFEASNQA